MKNRWVRFTALVAVLVTSLTLLTACVEGTVTYNSNPGGDPNRKPQCKISILIHNQDGPDESKTFEHRLSTCKKCHVGASFPSCKSERTPNVEKPNEKGDVIQIQVVTSSTSPGYSTDIYFTNADGKEGRPSHHYEQTRDKGYRNLAQTTDKKIRVVITPDDKGAVVSCEIFGPARDPWEQESGGGGVTCETNIASRYKK